MNLKICLITCAVSLGSQISNSRKSAHSVPPILCLWSAFFAENVCTDIPGQSLFKSKSNNLKFDTKILTSIAGDGFSGCGLAFVLTDKLRETPCVVVLVAVDDCEVDRDMLSLFALSQSVWFFTGLVAVREGASCGVVYAAKAEGSD